MLSEAVAKRVKLFPLPVPSETHTHCMTLCSASKNMPQVGDYVYDWRDNTCVFNLESYQRVIDQFLIGDDAPANNGKQCEAQPCLPPPHLLSAAPAHPFPDDTPCFRKLLCSQIARLGRTAQRHLSFSPLMEARGS